MSWRRAMLAMGFCASLAACSAILGIGDLPASDDGAHSDASGDALTAGDGTLDDGGVDEAGANPNAPRLLAPLSTSRVTSQSPMLHWLLPADAGDGDADVTVTLCSDRACTNVLGTPAHVTTGTSYRPPTLTAGVVFWHVASALGTSATWQFTVGNRSAPLDTSWGTTLDLNGDGYADVAVGAPVEASGAGNVYVYLGGASGLAATPIIVPGPGTTESQFGSTVASAGDVNGDGFADLLVGAPGTSGASNAYVFFGNAGSGVGSSPSQVLTNGVYDALGSSVSGAGDINGDGYGDVIVGAPRAESVAGNAFVYFGSRTGLIPTPAVTMNAPDGPTDGFGTAVAGAGDLNGDGFPDLAVGTEVAGLAYVYFGTAVGIVASSDGGVVPSVRLVNPGTDSPGFGSSIANGGDLNGDGRAVLVLGDNYAASHAGVAYVYAEVDGGFGPPVIITAPAGAVDFGWSAAGAGDVNGDGFADVIFGAPAIQTAGIGNAYLYTGSVGGLSPPTTLPTPAGLNGDVQFGVTVSCAGDVDGDGRTDLIVGAPGAFSFAGRAYVFRSEGTTDGGVFSGAAGVIGDYGRSVFGTAN